MANFISAHTGNEIDLSIASGSTTTGVIKDFNTLSGSVTSTINVGGAINTLSHITASGNLKIGGNATITGDTTINGNLTFGNSTSDSVNFGAEISSSIIPDADGTYNLGSVSKRWKELHSDLIQVQGNISSSGFISTLSHITASGNISSSGTVTAAAAVLTTVDINGGTINGITDLAVADGGTGVSTLTDGGVLLGNGTGGIVAMSVLTDGQMIVGDGTTDPVAESGATLRTSIGVGTTNNVQFAQITGSVVSASSGIFTSVNIDGGSITGITDLAVADGGTGAGTFTDGGILLGNGTGAIQATAVLTDGQMLVGDGTTDPAIESGATLRTSIGVGTGDNVTFTNITGTGNTALGNAAADTHTFVGNITASGNISASGTTHTFGEVTIDATHLFPTPDNGLALGKVGNEWADLFLNAGGVINFNNDMTITHLLAGNNLAIAGGSLSASGDFGVTGNATLGDAAADTHTITGKTSFVGNITASGNISSSGTITAAAAVLTTADINGGTVDGITSLTAGGNLDIGSHGFRAATITADGLTATRVPFAGANGLLSDDSDLTFATATLSATNLTTTGTIKDFGLVSGSVVSTGSFGAGTFNNKVGIGTTSPGQELEVVGNISSSGTITANDVSFNNLPVSQSGLTVGQLYTLSGSQLPFSGSTNPQISTKKFVLIA